jgi:class 3 adenylate cyclase
MICLTALLACLIFLLRIEELQVRNSQEKYKDYLVADELRQSSEDLTKMVRLYVLTQDPKYVKWYHEILGIRNGTLPLPQHYNEIYWDLILDDNQRPRPSTAPDSLLKRIQELHLPENELALLKKSERYSDELTQLEEEAIHAVSGKFKNAAGEYSLIAEPNLDLARRLVSNRSYMEKKAAIMGAVQEFYNVMTNRLNLQEQNLSRINKCFIIASIFLLSFVVLFVLLSTWKAFRSLSKLSTANEHLLLSALPPAVSERFKQGKNAMIKEGEVSVLFLDIGFMDPEIAAKQVDLLQKIFEEVYLLTKHFGVERIKTVQGDYMVVAGLLDPLLHHSEVLSDFALAVREKVKEFEQSHSVAFYVRMGMASGMVITGVLEDKKYLYDLWGDVLKTASRFESIAEKGEILISKKMASELKSKFEVIEKDSLEKSYLLKRRLAPAFK